MTHNKSDEEIVNAFKAKLWQLGLTAKDIDVDSYVSTLRQSEAKKREELLEQVCGVLDGMKKKSGCGCPPFQPMHDGQCWSEEFEGSAKAYNQALENAKTTIKNLLDDNK